MIPGYLRWIFNVTSELSLNLFSGTYGASLYGFKKQEKFFCGNFSQFHLCVERCSNFQHQNTTIWLRNLFRWFDMIRVGPDVGHCAQLFAWKLYSQWQLTPGKPTHVWLLSLSGLWFGIIYVLSISSWTDTKIVLPEVICGCQNHHRHQSSQASNEKEKKNVAMLMWWSNEIGVPPPALLHTTSIHPVTCRL